MTELIQIRNEDNFEFFDKSYEAEAKHALYLC